MPRYAIGDIQGCYEPLRELLRKLDFNADRDQLLLVGDLVNRVENWRAPGGGHAAPGLHSSLDDCYSSFGVLEKEADSVLASHDFRMLEETW